MKRYYCKTESHLGLATKQSVGQLLHARFGERPTMVKRRAKKLTRFSRAHYWTVEFSDKSVRRLEKLGHITTDNPCGIERWNATEIEVEFHHMPLKDVVRGVTGTAGRATQLRVQSATSINEADTIECEEEE